MGSQKGNWSKEYTFPSDMHLAHRLIDEVMLRFRENNWSDKDQFAVNLALEEALVNAVQHGNQSDPEKLVRFSCHLDDDRFRVRIEDEGEGFDPNAVPDPTDEEHIMIASGRGVLLIRSFVTNVRWSDRGNVLEFEKTRSPSEHEA